MYLLDFGGIIQDHSHDMNHAQIFYIQEPYIAWQRFPHLEYQAEKFCHKLGMNPPEAILSSHYLLLSHMQEMKIPGLFHPVREE